MMKRIAINRLVFSAVNGEVGLAIAVEIQPPQHDAAGDRLLEDSGGDAHSVPGDFAG